MVVNHFEVLNAAPPVYIFRCMGISGYRSYGIRDVGPGLVCKPHQATCYCTSGSLFSNVSSFRPTTAGIARLETTPNFSTILFVKNPREVVSEPISLIPEKNGVLHTTKVVDGNYIVCSSPQKNVIYMHCSISICSKPRVFMRVRNRSCHEHDACLRS